MQKKPWFLIITLSIMLASLFLSATQFNVVAVSDSTLSFFIDLKQESKTPTPTLASDEEIEDICGLSSEDCGDTVNSDAHSAGMNFEAHPFADVVIILFWMEDCAHCEEVLNTVLPSVATQYDDEIFIFPIELKDIDTVDIFYQMAERLGVPKNKIGVPLAIVGNQVLTGDQIESDLLEWVEKISRRNIKPSLPSLNFPINSRNQFKADKLTPRI